MLHADAKRTTYRADSAGVGRIDQLDADAGRLGFIGDEGLQLCPRPAVQSRAKALSGPDPFPDVRQVLQGDRVAAVSYRFRDDGLAHLMVDLSDMSGFAAGDFRQQLSCRLRAVALKPSSEGKVFVAVVSQFSAAEEFSRTDCGDGVLPKVDSHDIAGWGLGAGIRKIEDQVEEETISTADQYCFPREPINKEAPLEIAQSHRDDYPACRCEQGEGIPLDGIGSLVEVDGARVAECDGRQCFPLPAFPVVRQEGAVRLSDRGNGVAGHLRTDGGDFLADQVISQMVQPDSVGAAGSGGKGRQQVAGAGKFLLENLKDCGLLLGNIEFDADGPLHVSVFP